MMFRTGKSSCMCTAKLLLLLSCFCVGVVIGIVLNYYGYAYEAIRIHLEVSSNDDINNTTTLLRRLGLSETSVQNFSAIVVPNVVHFIWISPNGVKNLTFLNYVSILSAHRIQKPDTIMLHCNSLPVGKWWEKLWRAVPMKIVHMELVDEIHGQPLKHIYHQGDVAKIEILLKYGGIYLDYDVIVLNSLNPLRGFDATMGREGPPKLNAGVIVARKGSAFLRLLRESYRDNYRPRDWDYNCARVAYQIYLARPDLLHMEPFRLTTPDWNNRHQLWDEVIDWRKLYVLHVMAHEVKKEYTPENIQNLTSTFGEVMRFIYYGEPS